MEHRYKLASVVLSAGIVIAACGNGGEDGGENAENTESTEVDQVVEDSGSEGNSEGEATTEDSSSEGNTENDESVDDAGADEAMSDSEEVSEGNGDDGGSNASKDQSGEEADGSSGDTITQEDISHDAKEAVDAAEEIFEGELIQVELDNEDNQWVYKVDLEQDSEEHEVLLSIDDLSVVNESTDTDDDDDTEDQFNYEDALPAEEAVQTAIGEAGGNGEIEGWSLDKDDGTLEYEIELKNTDNGDADIKIDAESGDILENESDDDDD
ncbi:PepSY domain-containing protein [Salinicoccus sp. HZC-1]|uniref:PepSY domain-containing protein n=1 Tax=Salinicoccus sp. HZC-1 TaxID=3385497 RepID=UPI00398B68FC